MTTQPRNINEARTLANIAERASRITADYHVSILGDAAVVAHNADTSRRYTVKDGVCTCPSFLHNGTCKHALGFVALVEAEVARLVELLKVMDSDNIRRMIETGRDMAEAARCEMSLASYREGIALAELAA